MDTIDDAPIDPLLTSDCASDTAFDARQPQRGEPAPGGDGGPSTSPACGPATRNIEADSAHKELVPVELVSSQPARQRASRMAEKHLAFIQRVDRRVRKDASAVVEATFLAADIDDDSPKPEGWTKRQYRIARDARRSKREAPEYLQVAQRVYSDFQRKDMMAERQPAPVLNVETIQVAVSNTYNYEVIDSEPEK